MRRKTFKESPLWVPVFVNMKQIYFCGALLLFKYVSVLLPVFTINMTQWWLASINNKICKVCYLDQYEFSKINKFQERLNGPSWYEFMRLGYKLLQCFQLIEKQEKGHLQDQIWITEFFIIKRSSGTSLVVQWLRLWFPKSGNQGSIPGWEIRSHMLQINPNPKDSPCHS